MKQENNLQIDGYVFLTEDDAKKAQSEKKRIDFIESKLDYTKPESILLIYKKAISERIFKTPVGIEYLRGMQRFLLENPQIDSEQVTPVPIYYSFEQSVRERPEPARERIKPAKPDNKRKQGYTISVILNCALIVALIAMFMISLNAEQPNILNYEQALVNRYASWEQQLTQRELEVKEKEKQFLTE